LPIIWILSIAQTLDKSAKPVEVNTIRIAKVSRYLTAAAGVVGLVGGFIIVPHLGATFNEANAKEIYFGIARTQFFSALQFTTILLGIGLLLPVFINPIWTKIKHSPKFAWVLQQGLVSLAIFSGAFLITSPNAVFSLQRNFLRGFLSQVLNASFGPGFKAEANSLIWVQLLWSAELLDGLTLGLIAVALALTVHRWSKDGWRRRLQPNAVLWGWAIFYLILLLFKGKFRTHRALLPIIPFLIMFAAHALNQGVRYAKAKLPPRLGSIAMMAILLTFIGLELPKSLGNIMMFRHSAAIREQTGIAVSVGHWLEETYPTSICILHDNYSYVPPTFKDAYLTPWGGTLELLQNLEPDVVLVTATEASLFVDLNQANRHVNGPEEFITKHEYYAALSDNKTDYVLVQDFGEVLVYEKQPP